MCVSTRCSALYKSTGSISCSPVCLLQLEMKLSSSCNNSQHQPGLRLMIGHCCCHLTNLLNSQVPGSVSAFWAYLLHLFYSRLPAASSHHLTRSSVLAHLFHACNPSENIICQLRRRWLTCQNTDLLGHVGDVTHLVLTLA